MFLPYSTWAEPIPRSDNPPNLTCQTPAGIAFRVTAEGLSEIRFGQNVLARGGWSVFNAEPWFKDAGTGRVEAKDREKSIEVLGPKHARVRHVKRDVSARPTTPSRARMC